MELLTKLPLKPTRRLLLFYRAGVNVITPSSHKQMAQNILDNDGCLLSEYEPKAKVTKSTYVERDAVVAALANATMVIECSKKSGTMHTVNSAFGMKKKIGMLLYRRCHKRTLRWKCIHDENQKSNKSV